MCKALLCEPALPRSLLPAISVVYPLYTQPDTLNHSSLLQPVHVCSRFHLCLYTNAISPLPLIHVPNLCLILPTPVQLAPVWDCLLSPRQSQSLPVPAMPRADFLMSLHITLPGRSCILWTAPHWTIYRTYTQQLCWDGRGGNAMNAPTASTAYVILPARMHPIPFIL